MGRHRPFGSAQGVPGFFIAVELADNAIKELEADFAEFDDKDIYAKSLNYQLPDKYKLDYLVYAAGKNSDPEIYWNMPYQDLCKTMMLRRFDEWFQKEYSKARKKDEPD